MRGHFCFVADARAHQLVDGALYCVAAVAPGLIRVAEIIFQREPFQLIREPFQVRQLYGGDSLAERIGLRGGECFLRHIDVYKRQFLISEPTIISAPTSLGSMVSTNSP